MASLSSGAKYMLISVVFFAAMNVGVKWLQHIPVFELVFFRAAITLVISWGLLRRRKLSVLGNNKKVLLLRGASGALALCMYFYALQNLPLATAVTLQHMSPLFTILLAGWLLKERARPVRWLLFILAFVGVLMVKGFDPRVDAFGVAMGVGAAIGSAFAYNFIRMLRTTDDPLVVVFYFPLVTIPLIGPLAWYYWVWPSGWDWLVILVIGLSTQVAQVYMTKAYQVERADRVSIFTYLGVIVALMIGYFGFAESMDGLSLAGIGLIVVAAILNSRQR